jgi:hypothetical protein
MLLKIRKFALTAAAIIAAALPAQAIIAPSPITNLTVAAISVTGFAADSMTVTLTWSAPGEEGGVGTLNGDFSIRWSSSSPIVNDTQYDNANFALDIATTGVLPGETHTAIIGGLDRSATHYFVIKSTDAEGLTATLSNGATALSYRVLIPGATEYARSTAWGDCDGDGDLDLYIANSNTELDAIYVNTAGSFVKNLLTGTGQQARGIAWCDVNNDGALDMAVANTSGQDEYVMVNQGNCTFSKFTLVNSLGNTRGVACGDYDQDGDFDLAFSETGNADEYIAKNLWHETGVVSFSTFVVTGSTGDSRGIAWADYDSDGDIDLGVANTNDADTVLVRNLGGGVFSTAPIGGTMGFSRALAWADYNEDGEFDIGVANRNAQLTLLSENTGSGTVEGGRFTNHSQTGGAGDSFAFYWFDIDHDGDHDAVVGNVDGEDQYILINDGSNAFDKLTLAKSTGDTAGISIGDFDDDGDPDVAIANRVNQQSYILRNDSQIQNTAPTPPTSDFNTSFTEHSVLSSSGQLRIEWDNAGDDVASLDQLKYWVRIGTTVAGSSTTMKIPPRFSFDGYSGGGSWWFSDRVPGGAGNGMLISMAKGATAYWAVVAEDSEHMRSVESAEQETSLFAPSPLTDLRVEVITSTGLLASSMTVTLAWTAPGDDGALGAVTNGEYDIRWATTPIASNGDFINANFTSLVSTSFAAGEYQYAVIPGLDVRTTYYFAVTTKDGLGVRSTLSNTATGLSYIVGIATGTNTRGVAFGDYDNDGDLDVALAQGGGVTEIILKNEGGVYYQFTIPSFGDSSAVAWADFDRDGDLDLAISNRGVGDEVIMRNDGSDSFSLVAIPGTAGDSRGIAWGDYNNDGYLDLLVGNEGNEDEVLIINNGDASFSTMTLVGTSSRTIGVAWADYNNDGWLDFVAGNYNNEDDYIATNNGDGTFTYNEVTGSGGFTVGVAWGDVDGDGDLDVVAAVDGNDHVLRNDGGGTFTSVNIGGTSQTSEGIALADIDNDGDLDAVVANNASAASILLTNNGAGSFGYDFLDGTEAKEGRGISLGDADQDGTLDIVQGIDVSGAVLLRNDATLSPTAPTAPLVLSSSFTEYSVNSTSGVLTMEWAPGSDVDETTATLRYFVRLGTSTGNSELATLPARYGQSGYGGGFLHSFKIGPVNNGRKLVVNKGDDIYWAVTTEDSTFLRSAPSVEQSANLTAPSPVTDLLAESIVSTGLSASSMSVTLAWTSPGADGASGAIVGGVFDIRYSSIAPIADLAAYGGASYQQAITTNASPGTLHRVTLPGLNVAATHYFSITVLDEFGVRSTLSNGATALSYIIEIPATSGLNQGIAWGDYDGDGDLDFAVIGAVSYVGSNNSDGTFSTSPLTGITGETIAWGDYDRDGDLDLAVASSGSADELILRNTGGVFADASLLTGSVGASHGVAWGDYDNDGDLDLAVSNKSGEDDYIAENQGDGTFSTFTLTGLAGDSRGISWADYDADGDLDLAVARLGTNDVILRNDGSGTFTEYQIPGSAQQTWGFAWGDADGDGDLDLLGSTNGSESLHRNNGDGTFTRLSLLDGVNSLTAAWGDFDNDNDLDGLSSGQTQQSSIQDNQTGLVFNKYFLDGSAISDTFSHSVGDFDGDGDQDVIAAIRATSRERIYRNDTAAVHTAPAAPASGLAAAYVPYSAFASSGVLTLQWDAGIDGETSAALMNYRVRIGTTPAGGEIAPLPPRYGLDGHTGGGSYLYGTYLSTSPLARGLRLVISAETTAYWAVTTEDATGQRSAETAEQTANLTAPRALADLTAVANTTINTSSHAWINLTFTAPGENGAVDDLQSGTVYDVRWSTAASLATEADYLAAPNQILFSAAGTAGIATTKTIEATDPTVTHYFAVTTIDSFGVRSGLSNAASFTPVLLKERVYNTAIATTLQGTTTGFLRVDLWTDAGAVRWTGLRLRKTGGLADAGITNVGVYSDNNLNGVFDAADIPTLRTNPAVFSASASVLSFSAIQTINTSTKTYFVAATFSPSFLPVEGSSVVLQLDGEAFEVLDGAVYMGDFPAMLFDGVDDRTLTFFNAALNVSSVTVEAWVKTTDGGVNRAIALRNGAVSGWGLALNAAGCGAGVPTLSIGNQALCANQAGTPVTVHDGNWHHIAAQYAPSVGKTMFVDGVPLSTGAIGGTMNDITNALGIGGPNASGGNTIDGLVDEVRVSNMVRYSTAQAFIPTKRHVSDGNTAILYHFDATGGNPFNTQDDSAPTNLTAFVESGAAGYARSSYTIVADNQDVIFATATQVTQGVIFRNAQNVPMLRLKLWTDQDTATLEQVIVNSIGNGSDAGVTNLQYFLDDGDDVFEPLSDTNLITGINFVASSATFDLAGSAVEQTINQSTRTYFVVWDVTGGAELEKEIGLQITTTANLVLTGTIDTVNNSNFPVQSTVTRVVAADVFITPELATGTWVNFSSAVFRPDFSQGNVDRYHFAWDQNPGTNITSGDPSFNTGKATFTATSDANNWYYHVRPFDVSSSSGPQVSFGPFFFDQSLPTGSSFLHEASSGGFLAESQFNLLASGVTAQITVQDLVSGVNVDGPAPVAVTSETLSLFRFDETSGSTIFDSGPLGNDLAVGFGTLARFPGRFAGGQHFDGGTYLIDPGPVGLPAGNSARTVEAWVMPRSTYGALGILSWGPAGLDPNRMRLNDGVLSVDLGGGYVERGTFISTGVWHHVAYTFDGTNTNYYVDGQFVGTNSQGAVNTGLAPLHVGRTDLSENFYGELDEVRVLNRALTQGEIQAHAERGDPYYVSLSTDAGASWYVIHSTVPAQLGYVSLTGVQTQTTPQTLKVRGLELRNSTSTQTGNQATNQLQFHFTDAAYNLQTVGPFGLLVDSNTGVAISTPILPVNGAFTQAQGEFYWVGPSTTLINGMQGSFYLQVDDAAGFTSPEISIATPALSNDSGLDRVTARYISTFTLTETSTYFWRVRSQSQFGVFGPWSSVSSFVVDDTSPTGSGFIVSNSTGGFFLESEAIDLVNGATATLLVQDPVAGLGHVGEFDAPPGTIGLFHFSEVDGAFPADDSGQGNDGAMATGGPVGFSSAAYSAGHLGSGIECRSSQFHLGRFPGAGFVTTDNGDLTIEAWIRPNSVASLHTIAGQGSPIGGGANYVFLVNSGRLQFVNNTGGGILALNSSIDTDVWQFVAMVASGTHISFYKNGVRVDSGLSGVGGIDASQSMDFTVCGSLNASGISNSHFAGGIDEVRVITSARSPEEIAADYEATKRGRFSVEVSSDAGYNWTVVSATYPAPSYPHLAISGPEGSNFSQTVTVRDLQLVHSTNTIAGPGATNLVRFNQADLTGWRDTFGPYSVLVDTAAAALISTPTVPLSGSFVGYGPEFAWDGPSSTTFFQMGAPPSFLLEIDDVDNFITPVAFISTPAVIESTISPVTQGVYVSTIALLHNTTYFWRVRSPDFLNILSPARTVGSFVTDFASPTTSGFVSRSSTGGLVAESIGGDIALGATVHITAQDTGPSGLSTTTVDGVRMFGVIYTTQGAQALPVWIDGTTADSFASAVRDDVTALATHQNELFAGTGPGAEVFRFTNGVGWNLSGDLPGTSVTDFESFQGALYATMAGSGEIYRFTGVWSSFFDTGETGGGALRGYRGRLYAGMSGSGQVWVYDPAVAQWHVAFNTGDTNVTAIEVYQGRLFVGTDNAVYEFNGNNWSLSNTVGGQVNAMQSYNGRLYAATSFSGQVREYNGTTWSVHFDPAESVAESLGVHDGRLYVGIGVPSNGRVYTFDGNTANTWVLVRSLPGAADRIRDFQHFDNRLYTAADISPSSGVVFVSTPLAFTLSGPNGSTIPETFEVTNLDFANSGNNVVCGGLQSVCAASNQVRFSVGDRAGRVHASGAYAILVDTLLSPPTISFPLDFTYQRDASARYSFHESTVQATHNLQFSRFANFGIIDVSVNGPASFLQPVPPLNDATTYYWRMRAADAVGIFSNFSSTRIVFTDYLPPTLGAYQISNATNGLVTEGQFTNLLSGVTVQMDVQDGVSGLPLRPAAEGNPLGYWPFQENTGTLAANAAGGNLPAYLQNGGMWTTSLRGNGIDTSGGTFVDVSSPTSAAWSGMTVMMWAQPVSDSGFRTLWSNNQIQFHTLGSGNRVDFGLRTTGGGGCATAVTPRLYAVGQWQHVTFVADTGANENRIYINGELMGSCSGAAGPIDSPYRFGADGLTGIGGVDAFTGGIDEVRLYNRGVSLQEIRDEIRGTRYWVAYTTTAAQGWNVVGSTSGAGAHLATTGQFGSFSTETIRVENLTFVESTNTLTCNGIAACGATNQTRFFVADRAGNIGESGAFAVRVDTSVALPLITSLTPLSTHEMFVTASATDSLSGIGDYLFEASTSALFAFPVTGSGFVAVDSYTFSGLLNQTTYFVRVTVRDQVLNYSTPSVSVATQTFGTVIFSTASSAPATAEQNTEVAMLRFGLQTTAGQAKFASLIVQQTGTAADTDIAQARIYRDNGDLTFNSASDIFLAGAPMTGGISGITIASPQTVAVDRSTYFVVYQIAAGAAVGQSVGLEITVASDVGLHAPAFADGPFPTQVAPILITEGANLLNVNFIDLAPGGGVTPNSSNVPMLRFNMNTDVGTSELTDMVVRLVGTMPSNEVAGINFWRDADADGIFNAGLDDNITAVPGLFTAGVATLTFTGPISSRTIGAAGERFFLTFDISLGATQGNDFQVLVSSESEVRLSNALDTVVFPAAPVESGTGTVIINNILAVSPADVSPVQYTQGTRYAVVRATLTVDTGNADINRLSIDRTGAGTDADVEAVEVYRDQTLNGGPFNEFVDVFLGSAPFTAGRADVDITTDTVASGATTVMFIVYKVDAGANPGDELGGSMANATFVRAANPTTMVQGPFPFATSTAPVVATVNTMLIPTALSVAPGGLEQGASNVPMLRFDAFSSNNNFSWLGITLDRLGTGTDADVPNVAIYLDDGGTPGVFDSSDTLITSGGDAFAGGSAAIALTSVQTISASTKTYFVTMSVAPTAVPGATLGVRISSQNVFNISAPNLVDPALSIPVDAGPVAVTQFANTISVSTTSIVPVTGAEPGTQNIGMMALELNTDVSNADFLSIVVEEVGSAADAEISAVKVYFDINDLGVWNASNLLQYQQVSLSTQSFGDVTPNFVTLNFSTPPALSPTVKRFFVVIDLSSAAVPSNQVVLRAIDNTSFAVNPPNFVAPTSYLSEALDINAPPETMFVVPRGTAPFSVTQGDTNVVMEEFDLVMSSYTGQFTRLTVTRSGLGLDTDVAIVKLFYDANSDGVLQVLGDTKLSTAVYSGGQVILDVPAQTITTANKRFFVTYDIAQTAVSSNTVGVRVAAPGAFIVAAPNSVSATNFPVQSTNSLILPTIAGMVAQGLDQAPGQLLQGATNQVMLRLSLNTTEHAVLWTGLTVRSTGTAADGDIAAINIWHDVNTNNVLEPGIDTRITSGLSSFLGGQAVLSMVNTQTIGTAVKRYLVSVDMAQFANPNNTFGLVVESTNSFILNAPNYTQPTGLPSSSFIVDIDKLPEQLQVAPIDLTPGGGMNQGFETVMARIDASATRSAVQWTQLRMAKTGNLGDGEVTAMRIYRDSDLSGTLSAGDLVVGSNTFSAGQVAVVFSSAQTVAVSTQTYFVTAELNVAATVGANFGFTIPGISFLAVSIPDTVSSVGLPFSTALATVLDSRTPTQPIVVLDGAVSSNFEFIHFTWSSTIATGSIVGAEYAVGVTPGGQETRPWTSISAGDTDVNASGFPIASGSTYYVSVRAESNAGFKSPVGTSAGVLMDFTIPTAPAPNATAGNNTILITWGTVAAGPSGILGYLVEYQTGDSPQWRNAKNGGLSPAGFAAQEVQLAAAVASTDVVTGNSFQAGGIAQGTVLLRMRTVSGAGVASAPSNTIKLQLGPLPDDGIANVSNYPNPFDSRKTQTTIHYALGAPADVSIKIYSVFGRLIKESNYSPGANGGQVGSNNVTWDGTDDSGRKVSKGIYIGVIQSGGAKEIIKIGVIH